MGGEEQKFARERLFGVGHRGGAGGLVQPAEGLVQHRAGGVGHCGPHQSDPPPLPAREQRRRGGKRLAGHPQPGKGVKDGRLAAARADEGGVFHRAELAAEPVLLKDGGESGAVFPV